MDCDVVQVGASGCKSLQDRGLGRVALELPQLLFRDLASVQLFGGEKAAVFQVQTVASEASNCYGHRSFGKRVLGGR